MNTDANVGSTENTLRTVFSLLNRHPYLPESNLNYNRNFVWLLQEAAEVIDKLAEHGHHMQPGACERLGVRFTQHDDVSYDQDRIDKLKDELLDHHHRLAHCSIPFSNIKNDFLSIKKYVQDQGVENSAKQVEKLFRQLVILSPFIYDNEGNSHIKVLSVDTQHLIKSKTPAELDNLYCDYLSQHLAPLLTSVANEKGLGAVHKITRYVLNQFIPRTIQPALQLYTSKGGSVASRTIVLEEVPPIFSPLRGALAGDCSMVSVPFHGLLKDNHTFWIRKSEDFNRKPDGYVIISMVEKDGKPVPYIITINGVTLTQPDCTAVCHLIAHKYQTKVFYVANLDDNPYYVNTKSIKEAFLSIATTSSVVPTIDTIGLTEGWDTVDKNTVSQFENYYAEYKAKEVWHAKIEEYKQLESWLEFPSEISYQPPMSLTEQPILTRAILLYYYQKNASEEQMNQAMQLCYLNKEQVEAVEPLIHLYRDRNLNVDGFEKLNTYFDFGIKDLLNLDLKFVMPEVRMLYDRLYDRFPESEWVELVVTANKELNDMIEGYEDQYDVPLRYKRIKASLPDVYLPNYWDELKPFLFLPDGYPNTNVCENFVYYFHSIGTIKNFLEYMLEHDEILKNINTEDPRWSDFFIRARNMLEDQSKVNQAIELAYIGYLRNIERYGFEAILANTLFEYERIIGERCPDLKQEIINNYLNEGWQASAANFNEFYDKKLENR